jgi:hypothetical protein
MSKKKIEESLTEITDNLSVIISSKKDQDFIYGFKSNSKIITIRSQKL